MLQGIIVLYLKFHQLMAGEEGQDLVEYGLLASLLAVAAIAGIGHVADVVVSLFTNIDTTIAANF